MGTYQATYVTTNLSFVQGSYCQWVSVLFLSEPGLNFLLHTVISDGAYLPTLIVQGLLTKFNQRPDRMADVKSLVILK